MSDNKPIIHLTNSIGFMPTSQKKRKIYIKVSNLASIDEITAEYDLKEKISSNNKYTIVQSSDESDIIVEARIMFIVPLIQETFDRISKYWTYKSVIDNGVINDASDLGYGKMSISIKDSGIGIGNEAGNGGAGEKDKKDVTESILTNSDAMAGAIVGGSLAAFFGLSPALITTTTVAGGVIGGVIEKMTSIKINMAVVDIIFKEKVQIQNSSDVKTKYKNISSMSKNTITEVYVDEKMNSNVIMEHSTRMSVISKTINILPLKVSATTNNAIVDIISEILR